jgi:hypothetical protein
MIGRSAATEEYMYLYRMEPLAGGGYHEVPVRVEAELLERIPIRITGTCSTCGVTDRFALARLAEVVCDVCGAGRAGDRPAYSDPRS